jgi:glycosyltransferase involved in cell wall biosynthesis
MAPWYLHTALDVLWVAGERQRQLAYRLGFRGEQCWSGYYACDWQRFADVYDPATTCPKAFLFIGRYVAVKGIDVLVEAYRRYRDLVDEPWPLICAGTGEARALLAGQEGILDKGFVQPDVLPALMREAGAFILPSRREPWGVVVQEAAASGLPLLCSDACGAAVHLLQDGYNGFLFETGNARHLARCMVDMTHASPEAWGTMRARSHQLSKQYTPQRWADTFIRGVASYRSDH